MYMACTCVIAHGQMTKPNQPGAAEQGSASSVTAEQQQVKFRSRNNSVGPCCAQGSNCTLSTASHFSLLNFYLLGLPTNIDD